MINTMLVSISIKNIVIFLYYYLNGLKKKKNNGDMLLLTPYLVYNIVQHKGRPRWLNCRGSKKYFILYNFPLHLVRK